VVFVPFDASGRPTGAYEEFVTGFLLDAAGPTTWGRPVGVIVHPDGSLLFTEEANGRIFRVTARRRDD
jgi:glucose/arabinose dehydrogenase